MSCSKPWNLLRMNALACDRENLLKFLQEKGVIPTKKQCPKCGAEMHLDSQDFWRCGKLTTNAHKRKIRCETKQSIRKKTWFSCSKIGIEKILPLTYMLLRNYSLLDVAHELDVNKNTVSRWISFVRQARLKTWSKN